MSDRWNGRSVAVFAADRDGVDEHETLCTMSDGGIFGSEYVVGVVGWGDTLVDDGGFDGIRRSEVVFVRVELWWRDEIQILWIRTLEITGLRSTRVFDLLYIRWLEGNIPVKDSVKESVAENSVCPGRNDPEGLPKIRWTNLGYLNYPVRVFGVEELGIWEVVFVECVLVWFLIGRGTFLVWRDMVGSDGSLS